MSTAAKTWTMQDLLDMPDDGVRRWIINGELREELKPFRDRVSAAVLANVVGVVETWRQAQPEPRGESFCGECGLRLPGERHTFLGVDLAYLSPDAVARQPEEEEFLHGVPTLVVEFISPTTQAAQHRERLRTYRHASVPVVWEVDPFHRTVTVHRPHTDSVVLNDEQELTGDPELPGFRVSVARLFE